MSISKYVAFAKVAELGSLTRAAEVLGYTQPAISHIINSLEKRFGFPLFTRSRDACVLTDNGQRLLSYCLQIIKDEERLNDEVNSLNGLFTGSIRIGALSSMLKQFVPMIIHNFSAVYSNVDISLNDMIFTDITDSLRSGIIDIGFTSSKVPDKIKFTALFNDPVRLVIPHDHPFNAYDKVPVKLLNGCNFIMPSAGYDDVYKAISDKAEIYPNIRYYIGSDSAIAGMVANHLGISIMSEQQTRYIGNDIVCKEFVEDFHRTLGIAVNSQYHPTPAVKAFIKAAMNCSSDFFMNRI